VKPTVALLIHAADARARFAATLAEAFVVCAHVGVTELFGTLAREEASLVVIDAVDANGNPLAGTIAALRREFATLPVLVYCTLQRQTSSSVLEAVRAGATGLVFRGIDDHGYSLRAAVLAACRGSVGETIVRRIEPLVPLPARPLLRYAIASFADGPSVSQAAESLGVDRKTLFNWLAPCERVGPREFLAWCRLSVGVGLLSDRRRTVEQVALDLGFPSGASFRNMLQRYSGIALTRLRSQDGLAIMLDMFASALRPGTIVAGTSSWRTEHGDPSPRAVVGGYKKAH
jgi:AraC-like DNA-binding protein